MFTNKKIAGIALSLAAFALFTTPVLAQTKAAANLAQRITNWQARGSKEIDARVTSMNDLLSRVQAMKNVSDNDKAMLSSEIQSLVSTLGNLKGQIGSETSTTTLANDVKSITQSYRVYLLVEPQVRIIAAADRIKTIVNQLGLIDGKIQSRLAQDPTANGNASVQSALTDITAKLSDANTQAQAAVSEITALQPDQGDKTVMTSNTTTLKDARSKILAAQKDLVAAKKDAQSIVTILGKDSKSVMNSSGSATSNASTTQ